MGHVAPETQFNQHVSPAPAAQVFQYAYNLDGSLKSVTYPSRRRIDYGYNAAQKPISAKDSVDGINYVTNVKHTAFGAVSSLVNASTSSFAGIITTNYYNSRMQPCRITASSTGGVPLSCSDTTKLGNVLDLGYYFGDGQYDNGNVYVVGNNKDASRTQYFYYDNLNRLAQAWTPNSANWATSYGYDIWGNLLQKNKLAGYNDSEPPMNVGVDGNNHVTNWCYDAARNV